MLWVLAASFLNPIPVLEFLWEINLSEILEAEVAQSLNLRFFFRLDHEFQLFQPDWIFLDEIFVEQRFPGLDVMLCHFKSTLLWNVVLVEI